MLFSTDSLRHKIIKLIVNNPVAGRNTDIVNPYLSLSIALFFSRYKSVVVEELYEKGLIDLHGDVDLFIASKKLSEIKYLSISASLTQKGLAYYRLHIEKAKPETNYNYEPVIKRGTLSIVR